MDREFPGYDYGSTYRPARDYGNQDYSRDLRSRELNGRPRTYSNPEPGYPSSGFGPGYGYTSTGRTSGIRWQTELTPAAEFALQNRRPMIITVTAPWCSYCKKLKSESFEDAGFVRSVNAAQYVSVKIDSDVNKDLVSRMGIRSLPTTLIVSPDLRIVERMEGFRTAEQLSLSLRRHARTALKDSSVIIAKK
jgi:thiol-disulfide isomerase/thioredoxin